MTDFVSAYLLKPLRTIEEALRDTGREPKQVDKSPSKVETG